MVKFEKKHIVAVGEAIASLEDVDERIAIWKTMDRLFKITNPDYKPEKFWKLCNVPFNTDIENINPEVNDA